MEEGPIEAKVVAYKGERMAIVKLCGFIGPPLGFRAYQFVNSLNRLRDYDVLYAILDSPGGSAVDAWIIHDFVIKNVAPQHRSLVLIKGECSGDAILIALAFEQILMRPGAYIRLQSVPLAKAVSSRRATEFIARLIAQRIERRIEDVLSWMDKNSKFAAEECLKLSLCDAIV
jgi:ATP-dependent protease ClpP protease subunit